MRQLKNPDAAACIRGGNYASSLLGTVKFYQRCGYVLITVCVTGLPHSESGFFGLHIHEGSSCGGDGFSVTGSHYDPTGRPHPSHAGDLPPLLSCEGTAYLCVKTDRFRVDQILGRTMVIHSSADDFHTQPAGNAGTKIACGTIRRSAR